MLGKKTSAQEILCKRYRKSGSLLGKRICNWFSALAQTGMGIVHLASSRSMVKYMSLKTAASLGKMVLVLTDYRKPRLTDSIGLEV